MKKTKTLILWGCLCIGFLKNIVGTLFIFDLYSFGLTQYIVPYFVGLVVPSWVVSILATKYILLKSDKNGKNN